MKKVSFVIPCYRSEKTIRSVVDEIYATMGTLESYIFEVILVNDCSPDNTYETIIEIAKEHDNVMGISLARNFGQHAALMAGLRKSSGDYVVCLDDDGQTPANEVGKLLKKLDDGYDAVYASYDNKQHSKFRNIGSLANEKMTEIMLGKPRELYISSYFAVRRFVVDEMIRYEASYPYIIGLVLRSTKNICNVPVHHRARTIGSSGYSLHKLLSLWFNGFTAFSIKPLRIAIFLGMMVAVCGFATLIYVIINWFINPGVPLGWSSMMGIFLIIGGMLLLVLGMMGEYIGRIYISINAAPQYVIRDIIPSETSNKLQT
ncbi:glycosyltransferase family 2 protein [Butyrivibrio sp. INlla16]|uniref:glycosyltransferase family 2 protein n=1 Tax=Butyrivibrio sp. INlla16 TaxID=1520807 RepID=UPI0008889F9C|nr:glycosyltransferase family 2 protein [Butyrivibrio sp. INlla16]SDB63082.1 undecaprenyl-phosphate 4-deoxy-4-formamido-L-arabinose transferase [Butyrivibrio sp. INlla16]